MGLPVCEYRREVYKIKMAASAAFFMKRGLRHHLLVMRLIALITAVGWCGFLQAQLPYWWRGDHLASWIITDTYRYDVSDTLHMWLINPGAETLRIDKVELPGGLPYDVPKTIAPGDTGAFHIQVRYYGVGEGVKLYDHRVTVRANRYVPTISQYVVLVNTDTVVFELNHEGVLAQVEAVSTPMPYRMLCHEEGSLHEVGEIAGDGSQRLGTWLAFSPEGDLLAKTTYTSITAIYGYADSVWDQATVSFRCDSCSQFTPVLVSSQQYGNRYIYTATDPGILRMQLGETWAEWRLAPGRQPLVSYFPQLLTDSSVVHYRSTHATGRLQVDTQKAVLRAHWCWTNNNCGTVSSTFLDYVAQFSATEPIPFRRHMAGWYIITKPEDVDFDGWIAELSKDTLFAAGWLAADGMDNGQGALAFFGQVYLFVNPMEMPSFTSLQHQLASLSMRGGQVEQGMYVETVIPLRWQTVQNLFRQIESWPWVNGISLSMQGVEVALEEVIEH